MAHTKVTKTGTQNTGTANTFSYSGSFNVFKASEVEVELDNIALTFTTSTINESASPREYTVDYDNKTVHVGGADLASSNSVVIQPVTDMGAPTPRATYAPGSSVTSEDLNNNQLQLMRKAMEYDEQKLSSRGGTMTGNLHMGKNVDLSFEGDTDNAYETTITVTDPTSDKTITFPDTTGTVVTTGDTATVTATMLAANSVDSSELVDGSIDTSHIADSQVTAAKLGSSAVTTVKLATDAVTTAKITDANVTTAKIADSNVTTAKIADSNVTTAKINDSSVTTAKIADSAVIQDKLATNAVSTVKIAGDAVTTDKIAADAITGAKIADNAIDSEHYTDASIDHAHLSNNCIDGDNIVDDSINSEHYVDGSIDTAHIGDGQVTHVKLAGDAVDGDNIADNSINSEHYVDGSIDTAHIAGSQVTDAKLASNSVTTSKITDSNVTTVKIADDAISIAKIGCEQTTISDSDSHIPTSGAVVDYVAAQIAPIGGLEVIADEDNFPTSQPSAGVVISISDAAGIVVNGSGVSTTARTAGNGSDNVTINNFPSSLYSETLASGVGLMVSSTGSSHTYNYHKLLAAETDVKQLSDDINDFNARYRVNAGEPGSNNDDGDLVFDTNANKMKVYDATAGAWTEVTSTGDFKFLVPVDAGTTTAATFDGSDTSFDLKETTNSGSAASVTNINQLIVSLNGVIQKPNTGSYSASEEGFYLTDTDTIRFCTAPATGSTCFIIQCGSAVSIPTPGDGTVTAAKIGSGAVITAKIADDAVTAAKLASDAVVTASIVDDAVTSAKIADDAVVQAAIADASVDEARLQISNSPTNGYFLSAQSGNTGGLTWAQVTTDLVGDTSPQLGGNLDVNDKNIIIGDSSGGSNNRIRIGDNNDLELFHNGTNSVITNADGQLILQAAAADVSIEPKYGEKGLICKPNGATELYHDAEIRLTTISTGVATQKSGQVDVLIGSTDGSGAYLILDGDANGDGSGGDYSYLAMTTVGELDLVNNKNEDLRFGNNGTIRARFTTSGHFVPQANNTYDLGSNSARWQNIYTNDLNLSNKGSSNDVDGTWGDWTIQEGESDLFLKNNRSGKKYKFNLTEVS